LGDCFSLFGLSHEWLVPEKSKVSYPLSVGFHALPKKVGLRSMKETVNFLGSRPSKLSVNNGEKRNSLVQREATFRWFSATPVGIGS
jgi:hypothetical protein